MKRFIHSKLKRLKNATKINVNVSSRQIIITIIGLLLFSYIFLAHELEEVENLEPGVLKHFEELSSEHEIPQKQEGSDASLCVFPNLPIYNPEIQKSLLKLKKKYDPIKCLSSTGELEEDWVTVNGSWARVTQKAKDKYGPNIHCYFSELNRIDDWKTEISKVKMWTNQYKFKDLDFVFVNCTIQGFTKGWDSYLAAPRSNIKVPLTQKASKQEKHLPRHEPLNVLIWGFDSLSRNMFIRSLPESFSYLSKTLDGVLLKTYNVRGDGTTASLIPLLTGLDESDLPHTQKNMPNSTFVDIYPFIWKKYEAQGYLTGYLEDQPSLASTPDHKKYDKYCTGFTPRHKIMMKYIKGIFDYGSQKNAKKFVFSFHSELSHGSLTAVNGADSDFRNFLQNLKESGTLNNTLLIVMSDHGSRFSTIRNIPQGKYEEKIPFFMFVFPDWFKREYKTAYENLKRNTKILSNPFDIHDTLVDVLNLSQLNDEYFARPHEKSGRKKSLFRLLHHKRTCEDLEIEPHWCACIHEVLLNASLPVIQEGAKKFVHFVNSYLENETSSTSLCATLRLQRILWAVKLLNYDEVTQLQSSEKNKSASRQGNSQEETSLGPSTIQIKVETVPGFGLFEATFTHQPETNKFFFSVSDVSRTNKYGSQAHCVDRNLSHLKKMCYCSKLPSAF